MKSPSSQPPPRRLPAWDRAKDENLRSYYVSLEEKLRSLHCPQSVVHCHDPSCNIKDHSDERDSFLLDMLFSVIECSYMTMPLTGKVRKGDKKTHDIIPGWREEVEHYQLESNTYYRPWLVAGKPTQGEIFEKKRKSLLLCNS